MKRIIEAARGLLSEATQIVRRGKALVVACAVGAMIAGAFVVSTPKTSHTHYFYCDFPGGQSYCTWMCIITGHRSGSCDGELCYCYN